MRRPLKRCPNCLGEKFFTDNEEGMTFLFADADGAAWTTREPHEPLELAEGEELFCTGCGWHGKMADLLPGAEPETGEGAHG